MAVSRGTSFLKESGPAHDPDRKHLHIVLNDPTATTGQVIVVPIATHFDGCDETCIIDSYDHDWLEHRSYVAYQHASVEHADQIEKAIRLRILFEQSDAPDYLTAYIVDGLRTSDYAKPFLAAFADENGLLSRYDK